MLVQLRLHVRLCVLGCGGCGGCGVVVVVVVSVVSVVVVSVVSVVVVSVRGSGCIPGAMNLTPESAHFTTRTHLWVSVLWVWVLWVLWVLWVSVLVALYWHRTSCFVFGGIWLGLVLGVSVIPIDVE
jgi:hypothetical protein